MSERPKPIERWGLRSAAFYERCEGEMITVRLVTGEALHGELLGIETWTSTARR